MAVRDWEARTAISIFIQVLSSEILQFNVALRPQISQWLLGTATSIFTQVLSSVKASGQSLSAIVSRVCGSIGYD